MTQSTAIEFASRSLKTAFPEDSENDSMAKKTAKKSRQDLKPGEVLCDYCTAKCCRYFAFPIDTPKKRQDFDYLRWYLLHGRVAIFVEEGTWFLMVYADCKHLQADHRCGIYETRPQICRDYTTDNCEYDDDALYDMFFETPEQIWEYAQSLLPATKGRTFSTQPVSAGDVALPLLG